VAEKVLDFSVGQTTKNRLFDDLDDGFADNSGKDCCQDEQSSKLLESSESAEVCAAPHAPEVDDYGKHSARMEYNQEQSHGRRRWINAHQFLRNDNVSGTRHWEQFGQSL
jgi:hypothetical protein